MIYFFKKIALSLLLLGSICCLPLTLLAQTATALTIDKITVEKGDLGFWIKYTEQGKLGNKPAKEDILLQEEITSSSTNKIAIYSIVDTIIYAPNTDSSALSTIAFLLDVSVAMNPIALKQSKQMIQEVIEKRTSQSKASFYLTTFSQNSTRTTLTHTTADPVLNALRSDTHAPDFYTALLEEIKYLKRLKGNKALFIFSSGENRAESKTYESRLPYECEDIQKMIENLPFNFKLFPIVLNQEAERIKNLNCLEKEETTYYSNGVLPPNYPSILGNSRQVWSNFLIKAAPKETNFKGEQRNYTLEIKEEEADKNFQLGTSSYPINIQEPLEWSTWLLWLIIGITSILSILSVGSILIPYLRERTFIKKYVRPYIPEDNITRTDLLTLAPIQSGDLVVHKCQQISLLSTWKEGWQCPNYPVCMDYNCNGAGAPEPHSFFSLEGIFLKLNWIWFGAIGGLIAWIMSTLFVLLDIQFIKMLLERLLGLDFLNSISQNNPDLVLKTISNNLLVGIAFGTGLMLMLSWMEERRTSNKYDAFRSGYRILLRTLASILLSMLVFFLGFYLQYVVGIAPYLSGLVSWLLFGLCIGGIISSYSSIAILNGIIGGISATLAAFHVYWALAEWLEIGFMGANLISMILMGGLIGSILVSVVTTLEDFSLEILAPMGFNRTIPISKWLKSSVGVMIGKEPGSYIYIKWDDPAVRPEHAELFHEEGKVFIRPVEEVLVNRKLIAKPVPLKNGDVIQLGRASVTQFQFLAKA